MPGELVVVAEVVPVDHLIGSPWPRNLFLSGDSGRQRPVVEPRLEPVVVMQRGLGEVAVHAVPWPQNLFLLDVLHLRLEDLAELLEEQVQAQQEQVPLPEARCLEVAPEP